MRNESFILGLLCDADNSIGQSYDIGDIILGSSLVDATIIWAVNTDWARAIQYDPSGFIYVTSNNAISKFNANTGVKIWTYWFRDHPEIPWYGEYDPTTYEPVTVRPEPTELALCEQGIDVNILPSRFGRDMSSTCYGHIILSPDGAFVSYYGLAARYGSLSGRQTATTSEGNMITIDGYSITKRRPITTYKIIG